MLNNPLLLPILGLQTSYGAIAGEGKNAADFDDAWIWVGCCCSNGQRTVAFVRSLGDLAVSVWV
jgi:hypothetical protein